MTADGSIYGSRSRLCAATGAGVIERSATCDGKRDGVFALRRALGRMRGRMGEADTIRGVWLAALAIFRRYPVETLLPAAVLGAFGEAPTYLIDGRPLLTGSSPW